MINRLSFRCSPRGGRFPWNVELCFHIQGFGLGQSRFKPLSGSNMSPNVARTWPLSSWSAFLKLSLPCTWSSMDTGPCRQQGGCGFLGSRAAELVFPVYNSSTKLGIQFDTTVSALGVLSFVSSNFTAQITTVLQFEPHLISIRRSFTQRCPPWRNPGIVGSLHVADM